MATIVKKPATRYLRSSSVSSCAFISGFCMRSVMNTPKVSTRSPNVANLVGASDNSGLDGFDGGFGRNDEEDEWRQCRRRIMCFLLERTFYFINERERKRDEI